MRHSLGKKTAEDTLFLASSRFKIMAYFKTANASKRVPFAVFVFMPNEFKKYNLSLKHARKKNGTDNGPVGDLSYKCVNCGRFVSGAVFRFCGRDPERVFCYSCQDKFWGKSETDLIDHSAGN